MKKVLLALGVLVVLVIGALIALPGLVPAERIRDEAVAGVKAATGRDLSIQGKLAVSVFPSLSVQVGNIALANPPGFTTKDMVRLGALDIRLKLLPLISGRVEIDSFVLVDPVITLETDRQGRGNWAFDPPAGDKTPTKPAEPGKTEPGKTEPGKTEPGKTEPAGGSGAIALDDLRLGDIRIANGKLIQIDGKTETRKETGEINLQLSLKSLGSPLSAKGSLRWNGQPVTVEIGFDSLKAVIDGGTSKTALAVASEPLTLSLKGNAKGSTGGSAGGDGKGGLTIDFDGDLDLAVPSVRNLAAWAGSPIAMAGSGLGPLSSKGRIATAGDRLAFTGATIGLDAIKARGDVTVTTGGARPAIKGRLDIDMLDLTPYLPPEGATPAKAGGTADSGGKASPAPAPGGGKAGWSDEPIDASGLKAADVDFALTCAGIQVRRIKVGKSALNLALKDGRLVADLTELALYQGAGKGRVAVDGGNPAALGLDVAFQLKGLQAEPFLSDAGATERLSGTGNFDVAIAGRGKSQRQIVATLDGKGAVAFLNGAIKGINLAAMARNVATAFTGGAASSEKTDFAELGGSFTIARGILSNNDLALKSPLLRVEGKGTVDLPQRSVNYRVDPKVVASLEGQGGSAAAAGIVVPIIVSGPWDSLSYRPDLEALVKQNVGKAVEGVLGGGSGSGGLNPLKLLGR